MTAVAESSGFAGELRRWRSLRRWSQLDLAIRAGTTQRHLSFIEPGRSRPGRAMVVRLAESLELSLRERNALLASAGYAPVFPESPLGDDTLRPIRHALDLVMEGHMPYPAVIVRPYGVMVAANSALEVFTDGASAELLEPPVNVLRLALHPDGMASRVENLDDWAVTSSRTCAVRRGGAPTSDSTNCWPSSRATCRLARPAPTTWASPCRCDCDARRES